MSIRHNFALAAVQTNDLLKLCELLSGAVQNAMQEGQMPHMDPAINLICHHIAFCGNGDSVFNEYYMKVVSYCIAHADSTLMEKPNAPICPITS